MSNLYVQYGCGLSSPTEWQNFDASPTLRLQKIPFMGIISRRKMNFPSHIKYGNILKKLPGIKLNSCDGIYCSHVLEHLTLTDCRKALLNTFNYMKSGGTFRFVVPDLEYSLLEYMKNLKVNPEEASIEFLKVTMLGIEKSPDSIYQFLISVFGNSHHLWMWDQYSLRNELNKIGFINIRKCSFNDSNNKMFQLVEEPSRFVGAVSFEAVKP